MSAGPLLTVVIPVYNRAHCLPATLDSVAAQTLRPLSLIIVDNNSADASLEVARDWADRHGAADFDVKVLTQSTPGAAATRNRGLSEVVTPWVLFFDSDDLMDPDHLERIDRAIRANPTAEIIGWDGENILPGNRRKKVIFSATDPLWNNLVHGSMSTQRYAVRICLINSVGKWNEQIKVWDDMELGVRLLLSSDKILKLNGEPRVHIYYSTESITASTYNDDRAERALDAIEQSLTNAGRENMLKWVDLRRVQLAADYHKQGRREDAGRLLAEVVRRRGFWYRIIYWKHCIYPRGTYLMLRLMLRR